MWQIKNRLGFTLIELLVSIAIVAVLSGIGMVTFTSSQKRGRDARRVHDLGQYQIALENYASVNGGLYPVADGDSAAGSGIFASGGGLAPFLGGFPTDPQNGTYYYRSGASGTSYLLQGCMETTSTPYEFCSSGKNGVISTLACNANLDNVCDVP